MNVIGSRSSEDGPEKVQVACLRCGAYMWVSPRTLSFVSEGARPFCEECVAFNHLLAEGGALIALTNTQLDAMLAAMRRQKEIVRSN